MSASLSYTQYGGRYQGHTLHGLRDGAGKTKFSNPYFAYEGGWVGGALHGEGKLELGDGSSYEGQFVDGEIQGLGMRRWPDGSSYAGSFEAGEIHGQGTYISAGGEQYASSCAII